MEVKLAHVREEIRDYDEMGAIREEVCEIAPDDATRALEQHLRTVRMVVNGEASLNDLGGSYDELQATPETAALIRQAEEQGHD